MTFQKFISKLNWRQILIHFVATWFFIYAFQTLSVLIDIKIFEMTRYLSIEDINKLFDEKRIAASEIVNFDIWMVMSKLIGIFVAFIVALIISIRRHWFWFNSFIVLIIISLLARYRLLGWNILKAIFLTPGEIFKNPIFECLTNSIILLTIGTYIFFSKKLNQFIKDGRFDIDLKRGKSEDS